MLQRQDPDTVAENESELSNRLLFVWCREQRLLSTNCNEAAACLLQIKDFPVNSMHSLQCYQQQRIGKHDLRAELGLACSVLESLTNITLSLGRLEAEHATHDSEMTAAVKHDHAVSLPDLKLGRLEATKLTLVFSCKLLASARNPMLVSTQDLVCDIAHVDVSTLCDDMLIATNAPHI